MRSSVAALPAVAGAALLALAAAALPAPAAEAPASGARRTGAASAPESPFGINVHAPVGESLPALFDEAAAAGAGWVRVDFIWADIQPRPGRFDWRRHDAVVSAARRRGLVVLGLIHGTPAWATAGRPGPGLPRRVSDWQLFCFAAARRYRGAVDHWEVWNEPNLPRFFAGDRDDYVERILIPAADALHAADPRVRVGGPALAQLTVGDSDWHRWLYEVLLRAGDRLDFATHHLYDRDGHRDVTRRLERSTPAGDDPRAWDLWPPSVREVLAAAGWLGRPFWLTETGWPTVASGIARYPSEARQARAVAGLLGDWTTGRPGRDWLHRIFVYELADAAHPNAARYGLLRPDLSRKPAWHSLRDAALAWRLAHPPPPPAGVPDAAGPVPDAMPPGSEAPGRRPPARRSS